MSSSKSRPKSLYVLNSCLSDQITQSRIRLNLFSSREYSMVKLYFINDFRKAKKLERISGKELKSVVMRGKLELNIIYTRVERNYAEITECNFDSTTVNRATNYCYFVYAIQF